MNAPEQKHTILILGASGFIGNAIYSELCNYFRTFGTYNLARREFESNQHFFQYNINNDDIYEILQATKPSIIISCLRGDFHAQTIAHQHIAEYLVEHDSKIIFLSSANVFDAYSKYPSYELDKTFSGSIYGHFKIKIENMLLRLPKQKSAIIRLPMVLGAQSPRLKEIKLQLDTNTAIEVFPNIIMNVTTDSKITQQIHYIINRNKYGIFHLGSTDLVHHDEYFKDIVEQIPTKNGVQYKQVYTTNEDRYLAVLPKYNKLPKHLQITSSQVLDDLKSLPQ